MSDEEGDYNDEEGGEGVEENEKEGGEGKGSQDEVKDKPLNETLVSEGISLLCKTGDGMAHAYVRLDVHQRDLTDIAMLEAFIHLRYIDVSGNFLTDLSSLNSLTQLLSLKADNNRLTTVNLQQMPYLQQASFSGNQITSFEGCNHPLLEQLNLNMNLFTDIKGLEPAVLSRLHTLELKANKLTTTAGIYLPNLKNLFLAQNLISKIEGLERMAQLTTLHIRENQLENMDGFSEDMAQLQYINARKNLIASPKSLDGVQCLPLLRAIVLSENPCSEEDEYRMEVLIKLRRLERLDKDEFTAEEQAEAEQISEQRKEEETRLLGEQEEVPAAAEES